MTLVKIELLTDDRVEKKVFIIEFLNDNGRKQGFIKCSPNGP